VKRIERHALLDTRDASPDSRDASLDTRDAPRGQPDASHGEPDAKSSGVVAVPAITSHSVRGFVTLLREAGQWQAVRAEAIARDPFASHWIDRTGDGTWCPIDRGHVLAEATRAIVGDRAIRELGLTRFSRAMDTGVLAPMLRSWARTVAPDTTTLVKLVPHLWRAASQGLGDLKVHEVRPGFASIYFTSAHPTFLAMHAWHIFLEGFALGLLALRRGEGARLDDDEDFAEMKAVDGRVELTLRWTD
jgi:hypothetical protein